MRVLTNKRLQDIIDEAVKTAVSEAVKLAEEDAYNKGYHAGLVANKDGIYINRMGIYIFENGKMTGVKK